MCSGVDVGWSMRARIRVKRVPRNADVLSRELYAGAMMDSNPGVGLSMLAHIRIKCAPGLRSILSRELHAGAVMDSNPELPEMCSVSVTFRRPCDPLRHRGHRVEACSCDIISC